ncbi:mobilization protein [Desulfosarcina ovata]|uniref:Mobilization protein n=1 Tax=Desulfosarcina ovata subsp. ovata TaxID=2752305 RepID=A0A5K8A840_9BACT|nr:mobilization protein [Desulfosarcina ovata]BBO88649.1 hypothetical protein DSCOOX_18290 [Desulfosarcina ovata subsp. ovata]
MARIHFVGGEKGGVGKSVLSRILAQYHIDQGKPFGAFDGDLSHGDLIRYYGEYTETVDIRTFESADRIAEEAAESGRDVIVDLPAQASFNLDRWMADTGLVEFSNDIGVVLTLWHIMDDGTDSIRLLEKTLSTYGSGPDYVLVRNHGRGNDFSLFDESEEKVKAEAVGARIMDLPSLHAGSMRKIDRIGASLWAAANNKDKAIGPTLGLLERQRVKVWLKKAYAELDRVLQLPESPSSSD